MKLTAVKRWVKVLLRRDVFIRPQIQCPTLHFGDPEYDWTFCPEGLGRNSIVYSFGIGRDISFDLALLENYQLQVFAFDPTPKSIAWLKTQSLPQNFHFHPYGLSDHDGSIEFYETHGAESVSYSEWRVPKDRNNSQPLVLEVRRLSTICALFGHTHIDVLKMDIEGSEYRAIPDFLEARVSIGQILIEFHHRFGNIGPAKTLEAVKTLNRYGYKIFDVSPNGCEYALIREG
ncbi:MAG: FkbM family methyltransferase [Chloroflexota bacterium]